MIPWAILKRLSYLGSVTALQLSSERQSNFAALNYVRQGDHHVGHWPAFLVLYGLSSLWFLVMLDCTRSDPMSSVVQSPRVQCCYCISQ